MGAVQGVGYRWFARAAAQELGLSGWARNRDDGTVEVEAEGEPQALDEFVSRLRAGPPAAAVDAIEVQERRPRGERGFTIRR